MLNPPRNCKVEDCGLLAVARDLCNKHYLRMKIHGDTNVCLNIYSIHDRLKARSIRTSSGCLEWQGTLVRGYGKTRYLGKDWLVHRLAWELANGPIEQGMCACHKCDNRKCFELSHIFIGTQKENIQDALVKGRFGNNNRRRLGT